MYRELEVGGVRYYTVGVSSPEAFWTSKGTMEADLIFALSEKGEAVAIKIFKSKSQETNRWGFGTANSDFPIIATEEDYLKEVEERKREGRYMGELWAVKDLRQEHGERKEGLRALVQGFPLTVYLLGRNFPFFPKLIDFGVVEEKVTTARFQSFQKEGGKYNPSLPARPFVIMEFVKGEKGGFIPPLSEGERKQIAAAYQEYREEMEKSGFFLSDVELIYDRENEETMLIDPGLCYPKTQEAVNSLCQFISNLYNVPPERVRKMVEAYINHIPQLEGEYQEYIEEVSHTLKMR